ncbi:MAG: hypothetical protein ABF545_01550 [Bifidobacterium psychraerophilum]|uniref:hypothetical protein n=1 Tax=Bifidobacterium psychraerophilum TaxID=218140 RepID=UPI0039EC5E8A
MTATTPKFLLPYPVDSDNINKLPDILKQQAESIESALSGFDFDGQDTNGLASRITSLEKLVADLQKFATKPIAYSRSTSLALNTVSSNAGFTVISSMTPIIQSTDLITYANNAFKVAYDCILSISFSARLSNRDAPWTSNQRQFIELAKNYSGQGSPDQVMELGRVPPVNEDSVSYSYTGPFSAGDTVTPVMYNNIASRSISSVILSGSVQRTA